VKTPIVYNPSFRFRLDGRNDNNFPHGARKMGKMEMLQNILLI
jgi:hypothetical protein